MQEAVTLWYPLPCTYTNLKLHFIWVVILSELHASYSRIYSLNVAPFQRPIFELVYPNTLIRQEHLLPPLRRECVRWGWSVSPVLLDSRGRWHLCHRRRNVFHPGRILTKRSSHWPHSFGGVQHAMPVPESGIWKPPRSILGARICLSTCFWLSWGGTICREDYIVRRIFKRFGEAPQLSSSILFEECDVLHFELYGLHCVFACTLHCVRGCFDKKNYPKLKFEAGIS